MSVTVRDLEHRILLAVLGVTAAAVPTLACRKETVPMPAPVALNEDAAAEPSAIMPTPVAVMPAAASSSASETPSAPTKAKRKICANAYEKEVELCFDPFATRVRSTGTGEPAPAPPPSAYDKDGCLPKEQVSTGCCNPGVDGPRKKNGKCCYTACTGACCGRPFLVNGEPRVAAVSFGTASSWVASTPSASVLDPVTAQALGEAWLRDAQMEHASAAAFGRFLLQLLALGAPADLVRRAALAAVDEVDHAALCFTLAARYAASAPRPAPLALDGALDSRLLSAIVAEVIAEGCIGETLAALIAARQLDGAGDEVVVATLSRIAEDEARHAELAWSFVRWAIDIGGDEARAAARAAFARAATTAFALPEDTAADPVAWRRHGRLTKRETASVVRGAMNRVIAPCADALLAV